MTPSGGAAGVGHFVGHRVLFPHGGNLTNNLTLRRPDVRPYHDGATRTGTTRTAGGLPQTVRLRFHQGRRIRPLGEKRDRAQRSKAGRGPTRSRICCLREENTMTDEVSDATRLVRQTFERLINNILEPPTRNFSDCWRVPRELMMNSIRPPSNGLIGIGFVN
jgi:hypothetical protein